MVRMETMAEGMRHYFAGHHATMPGIGKTEETNASTRRLEDHLHTGILMIAQCFCKPMKGRVSRTATSDGVYMGLSPARAKASVSGTYISIPLSSM